MLILTGYLLTIMEPNPLPLSPHPLSPALFPYSFPLPDNIYLPLSNSAKNLQGECKATRRDTTHQLKYTMGTRTDEEEGHEGKGRGGKGKEVGGRGEKGRGGEVR